MPLGWVALWCTTVLPPTVRESTPTGGALNSHKTQHVLSPALVHIFGTTHGTRVPLVTTNAGRSLSLQSFALHPSSNKQPTTGTARLHHHHHQLLLLLQWVGRHSQRYAHIYMTHSSTHVLTTIFVQEHTLQGRLSWHTHTYIHTLSPPQKKAFLEQKHTKKGHGATEEGKKHAHRTKKATVQGTHTSMCRPHRDHDSITALHVMSL